MKRDLQSLVETSFDLVVVGGGVFGICVAWDAAQRGLSVALLERGDFCAAASANSFKMIHGGIRYMQHADLLRIRESCRERRFLLRAAPHLTRPLPIVIPTYSRGLERKNLLRAAFLAYDLATFDRNRGIRDRGRHIPRGRILSRGECLRLFPALEHPALSGAGLFHDGQMYNPPRLALAILQAAVAAGAQVANYVEAEGFLGDEKKVTGVLARDRVSGEPLEIRGATVVNAAGGWASPLIRKGLGRPLVPLPTFSRDACFVVRRRLLGDCALAVQGATSDPDAVLSRGHRHLFIVPWRDRTLIGVWHVVHEGDPDDFTVTREELIDFLSEVNAAYPSLGLTLEDVSLWNAGLVLFGENREGAVNLSYGKRSLLVDHARSDGIEGLITVVGVRWTTGRGIAERVVDLAFRKKGASPPRCRTEEAILPGGKIEDFGAFEARALREHSAEIPEPVLRSLTRNHGTAYRRLLEYGREDAGLGRPLAGTQVLRAEVVHAAREEMALTLGDIALRRTDLASAGSPGEEALEECADLAAAELGWDEVRRRRELEDLRAVFPRWAEGGKGESAP